MFTTSTNHAVNTFKNKKVKFFALLVANSDYDPDKTEDPQFKFRKITCAQEDLNRFKAAFGKTFFDFDNDDPTIARDQSHD